MKSVEELYPDYAEEKKKYGRFYGPSNYSPILESFGYETLLRQDDDDYQGDSRLLYKDGERYGYLIFGWGSCSGCDALQACDNMKEIAELQQRLFDSIKWFDSKDGLLQYFKDRDWSTDYSWHADETKKFVAEAIDLLSKIR